jgi:hypothetical protein
MVVEAEGIKRKQSQDAEKQGKNADDDVHGDAPLIRTGELSVRRCDDGKSFSSHGAARSVGSAW